MYPYKKFDINAYAAPVSRQRQSAQSASSAAPAKDDRKDEDNASHIDHHDVDKTTSASHLAQTSQVQPPFSTAPTASSAPEPAPAPAPAPVDKPLNGQQKALLAVFQPRSELINKHSPPKHLTPEKRGDTMEGSIKRSDSDLHESSVGNTVSAGRSKVLPPPFVMREITPMSTPARSRTRAFIAPTQPATSAVKSENMTTNEERLQQMRDEKLREINLRNRTKDKTATTSLSDLELARKPIRPEFEDHSNKRAADHTLAQRRQQSSISVQPVRAAELQPIAAKLEEESNAWGSSIPSNASQSSADSQQPLHSGKFVHDKTFQRDQTDIVGWDGQLQPPPVDWNERSKFDNESPEFVDSLSDWLQAVIDLSCSSVRLGVFAAAPGDSRLRNIDLHPDGLEFVRRDFTIDSLSAVRYGYTDIADVVKYSQRIDPTDFDDWGKLDLSRHENMSIKEECVEDLIHNWLAHKHNRTTQPEVKPVTFPMKPAVVREYQAYGDPIEPSIKMYLRPVMDMDIPQLTAIYNWYVRHSARPCELYPIDEADMEHRISDSLSNKLPFVVAVLKNKRGHALRDLDVQEQTWQRNSRIPKDDETEHLDMAVPETIVGWASAQDFTASDYVERISVEFEIYVDPSHRQKGIANCLLDQLLDACDRGHIKRGGYPFHCTQRNRHLYNTGGGRDVHKLLFVLRKWKFPRKATPSTQAKVNDLEDDYEQWVRNWLESYGFQVEGILSGIGAKNGRFVDTVYFSRETKWLPAEGQVPTPIGGG